MVRSKVRNIHKVCITIFLFLFLLFGIQSAIWAQLDSDGDLNADITDPDPYNPTQGGVYPGVVITYDVLMAGDLDATGFTGDVITITGDGITFDGNGYQIVAPDASTAIKVYSSDRIVLHGIHAPGIPNAIYFLEVTNSIVEEVTAVGNGTGAGIRIERGSVGNTIRNCDFSNHQKGVHITHPPEPHPGHLIEDNILTDCVVYGIVASGSSGYIGYGIGSRYINNDVSRSGADGVGIGTTRVKEIADNDFTDCKTAIKLFSFSNDWELDPNAVLNSSGNSFTRVHTGFTFGAKPETVIGDMDFSSSDINITHTAITVFGSDGVTLRRIHAPGIPNAIWFSGVTNSTVEEVTAVGNGTGAGIRIVRGSVGNTIRDCDFSHHGSGVSITHPPEPHPGHLIEGNILTDCVSYGIMAESSSGDIGYGIGSRYINNDVSRSGSAGINTTRVEQISGNDFTGCGAAIKLFSFSNDWELDPNAVLNSNQNRFKGVRTGFVFGYTKPGTVIGDIDFSSPDINITNTAIHVTAVYVPELNGIVLRGIHAPGIPNAIEFWGVTNSIVEDVTAIGNGTGAGIRIVRGSVGNTIRDCDFSHHGSGVSITHPPEPHPGHLIEDNTLTDCVHYGIMAESTSGDIGYGIGSRYINNDVSRSGSAGINTTRVEEISGNNFTDCKTGLTLISSPEAKVFHNNFVNNSNVGVHSDEPIELSHNGEGNYWGRACPGPLFVQSEDTNSPDVVDSHPYASFNGWLGGETPGCPGIPPIVGAITVPMDPVQVNATVNASATFTDPDIGDTHTAVWSWGDNTTTPQEGVISPVEASHAYDSPGVYTITLTVTDSYDESGESIFQYVVVYDPNVGFVTGGGWIDSPEGAYPADPSLTGKANFGFNSTYKNKDDNIPTGQTEFNFNVADLNFHSGSYEWLVVAEHKAQYKGVGTINGSGNYGLMLTVIDEKLTPSTDKDLFRIKIWDKDDNDAVVYDNQMGDEDDADPATAIGGGNITIHEEGNAAPVKAEGLGQVHLSNLNQVVTKTKLLRNYPNPFNPETWIPYQLKDSVDVIISIYDLSGRLVRRLELGQKTAGFYLTKDRAAYWDGKNNCGEKVSSGVYLYHLQTGDYNAIKRMLMVK